MTLCSWTVFLWLCVLVLLSWVVPKTWSFLTIILTTALFLSFHAPLSFIVLLLTTTGSFYLFQRQARNTTIVFSLIGLLSFVFLWFKATGTSPLHNKIFPLGISYYCLRHIHYLFERYKQKLADHSFTDYLCYSFFLPALLVGPIHRFPEFRRDLHRRRWDDKNFSEGLERILYGYIKIIVLGNFLLASQISPHLNPASSWLQAYLETILNWLHLYIQFSGYSDVAIGFSLLMGFRIIENFHYPFLARNINEFWQRWHISLSTWCRDYVYQPVAAFSRRPILAIIAAMLIIGIWHELSVRYIIWGAYHGCGIAVWHKFQRWNGKFPLRESQWYQIIAPPGAILLTLHFVIFSYPITKKIVIFLGFT